MAQVATSYGYSAAVAQPTIGTTATGQTPTASAYATQVQANTASATAAQHSAYQQMLEAYQRQQQSANPPTNPTGGVMYAAHPVQYDPSLYQAGSYQASTGYQQTTTAAPQQAAAAAAAAAAVASYQQQLAVYQQQQAAYQQQQQTYQQASTFQQPQQQQMTYQQQAYPPQNVSTSQTYPQYGATNPSYYGVPQQTAPAPPVAAAPISSVPPVVAQSAPYQDPYNNNAAFQQQPYEMAPRPPQYDGSSLMGPQPAPMPPYGMHRTPYQGYSTRGPRPNGPSMSYGPRLQRGGYTPRPQSTNQTPFLSFYEGDDNDTVPNIIFISELPQSISNELLAQEFSSCGPIATLDERGERPKVWIYKDRATRVPRGDATITFQDEESAKKAVEKYNDKELFGKKIKVSLVTIKQMNHQIQIRLQIAQNPRNNYSGGMYDSGGSYSQMGPLRMGASVGPADMRGQPGFYRDSVNGQSMTSTYRGQMPNGRGRGTTFPRGYSRAPTTVGPSRYASQGSPRRSRGRPGPY